MNKAYELSSEMLDRLIEANAAERSVIIQNEMTRLEPPRAAILDSLPLQTLNELAALGPSDRQKHFDLVVQRHHDYPQLDVKRMFQAVAFMAAAALLVNMNILGDGNATAAAASKNTVVASLTP